MEIKKKLNTPPGSIHDIKYLYNIIAGLKRKGGRVERNTRTFEYFKKMINDYNVAKASKYGLSFKPHGVDTVLVKHLITELIYLKLIYKDEGYLILTDEGENIASLIEKKESKELKKLFTKLMLENFRIFEYFLKQLKEISNGNGVPIPFITSGVFDKYNGDSKRIAENYINIVNKNCQRLITEPERLYKLLEDAAINLMEKRTDKIKRIQTVIEKFVVSAAFTPNIENRRSYDLVRSRTTFLELTNYATFDFEGSPSEVTYLISDFEPVLKYNTEIANYSGGDVFINCPTFEEIRELFKDSITKNYNISKDDFGYSRIAAVRDMVCRELKISDNLFDAYLKRLYKEEPHWLSFTYSGAGDKVTEKRLPIIFEKPMREFFTLLKI